MKPKKVTFPMTANDHPPLQVISEKIKAQKKTIMIMSTGHDHSFYRLLGKQSYLSIFKKSLN